MCGRRAAHDPGSLDYARDDDERATSATHNDPWTWHGWSVLTGERLGWFIDATFGHEAAELDALAPIELPHANTMFIEALRYRPELSYRP